MLDDTSLHRRFIGVSSGFHRIFIGVSSRFHRDKIEKRKSINMLRNSEICTVTFTPHSVNMSVKQGRICPICFKENLYYLNDHLRQVHQLSSDERKPWLKAPVFSSTKRYLISQLFLFGVCISRQWLRIHH